MPMTKLLYIDDEPINLKLFDLHFMDKFKVHTAIDGQSGLEKLEEDPDINIVISDMKMPQMTGIEFVALARKKYPDKNYFILTGYDINDEILRAIETGMICRYFSKPFNTSEITSAISEVA